MSELSIDIVSSRADLKGFINLPWKIYPRECNWVPPLKRDIRHLLDTRKHPFWKFSEQRLFLARRGGEVVGRIAGIIDNNNNDYHNEKMGVWGFFECMDDQEAASALFSAVQDWVTRKGMDFLRGPLNPSTNYTVGLLIEGFEYRPTIMMPWNHPYYVRLVEEAGFTKEKDLKSLIVFEEIKLSPRMDRLVRRLEQRGKVWSRNGSRKNFQSEMALIAEIYKSAWADNWGFVPVTPEESVEAGKELTWILVEGLTYFVYYDQDPAGMIMIAPDFNPLLWRLNGKIGLSGVLKYLLYRREIRGFRAMLFGVKKRYQKLGIPLVAANHLTKALKDHPHWEYLEFGWTLEDNDAINRFLLEGGAKINKQYRVFRKNL